MGQQACPLEVRRKLRLFKHISPNLGSSNIYLRITLENALKTNEFNPLRIKENFLSVLRLKPGFLTALEHNIAQTKPHIRLTI